MQDETAYVESFWYVEVFASVRKCSQVFASFRKSLREFRRVQNNLQAQCAVNGESIENPRVLMKYHRVTWNSE